MIRYLFLIFILTLLACNPDPLESFLPEIRNGSLHIGRHFMPLFENSLYEKIVKVNIDGQSTLIMEWAEDKIKSYNIHVRLLHGLESRYDMEINSEEIPIIMEGASFNFNSKTGRGVLKWKPSKTFTGRKAYRQISLTLPLEFRDRRSLSSEPDFVVKRKITVIVYKSLDPPEIYKIETSYGIYEKLDDGNFYTRYGAKSLDLSYYDQIFVGRREKKELFDNIRFYSEGTYDFFHSSTTPHKQPTSWETAEEKLFDLFELYDKFKKPVPDDLIKFINLPFYIVDKIRQNDEDCDRSQTVPKNQTEHWCLAELKEGEKLDFDKDLYVKHYQIPQSISFKNLFYKMQSVYLCEVYHIISSAYILNSASWKKRDMCYLSLDEVKKIKNFLNEKEIVYLCKSSNTCDLVDTSQWQADFFKIPESIKWQLAGLKPLNDNSIHIPLIRNEESGYSAKNLVQIYVRDHNQFGKAPFLIPHQRPGHFLFWTTPIDMDIKWNAGIFESLEGNAWKLNYSIRLDETEESKNHFHQFPISFQPVSQTIHGSPISLRFNILQKAIARYSELFDPEKDIQFSSTYDGNNWLNSSFSAISRIKTQYIFPEDFLSNIRQSILFDSIPFFKIDNKKSLLDHLYLQPLTLRFKSNIYLVHDTIENETLHPSSSESPSNNTTINETIHYGQFSSEPHSNNTNTLSPLITVQRGVYKKRHCDCSDWEEFKKDNQIYIEGTCFCEVNLQLDSDSTILKRSNDSTISFYLSYDYFLEGNKNVFLNNNFYKNTNQSDIPISLYKEPFVPKYNPPSKLDFSSIAQNRFHIFFNLQPTLKCSSLANSSDRVCEINYLLDQRPQQSTINQLNKEQSLFSEEGVRAVLFCDEGLAVGSGSKAGNNCPCSSSLIFNKTGLQMQCVFKKNQTGSLSIHLETDNPYIYFINIDKKHNESAYQSCLNSSFPHPGDCRRLAQQKKGEGQVQEFLSYGDIDKSHKHTPIKTFKVP